jgi:hypothetical protein
MSCSILETAWFLYGPSASDISAIAGTLAPRRIGKEQGTTLAPRGSAIAEPNVGSGLTIGSSWEYLRSPEDFCSGAPGPCDDHRISSGESQPKDGPPAHHPLNQAIRRTPSITVTVSQRWQPTSPFRPLSPSLLTSRDFLHERTSLIRFITSLSTFLLRSSWLVEPAMVKLSRACLPRRASGET